MVLSTCGFDTHTQYNRIFVATFGTQKLTTRGYDDNFSAYNVKVMSFCKSDEEKRNCLDFEIRVVSLESNSKNQI